MAKTRSQAALFDALAERYGREVAAAFIAAVDNIRTAAEVQRLTAAIEAGQIEDALNALHIDAAAYNDMLDAIRAAHTEGGQTAVSGLPARQADGTALVIRFNGRNPVAEAWLRDYSSTLITRIVEDQRDAVRVVLSAGMERGANPSSTALDIVGRINRATGRRSGGILGLTKQQAEYTFTARSELTSGDPKEMARYLTRARRDKRFDRTVKAAIRDGTKVPADVARKATTAYRNRLLQLRGEVIGKHETFAALAGSRQEAYRQAVESGQVSADAVTKTWRHFASLGQRPEHVAMAGKSVRYDRPFVLPDGTQMMFPHDPAAPVEHTANCRCQADYRVNWLAGLK